MNRNEKGSDTLDEFGVLRRLAAYAGVKLTNSRGFKTHPKFGPILQGQYGFAFSHGYGARIGVKRARSPKYVLVADDATGYHIATTLIDLRSTAAVRAKEQHEERQRRLKQVSSLDVRQCGR